MKIYFTTGYMTLLSMLVYAQKSYTKFHTSLSIGSTIAEFVKRTGEYFWVKAFKKLREYKKL